MHDKSLYEVEYSDGTMDQLTANISKWKIWLNQFSQTQHPQFIVLKDVG